MHVRLRHNYHFIGITFTVQAQSANMLQVQGTAHFRVYKDQGSS